MLSPKMTMPDFSDAAFFPSALVGVIAIAEALTAAETSTEINFLIDILLKMILFLSRTFKNISYV